ncbi:pyrimidine-nucleoside phosphorylase [uncultured Clostridium sp.]|uniref:pyrimidine-nucleoside phosphorylase n=1 Tax=uncultured Clostridium sp. TaxID=59620 RepID=UPI00261DFB06|nr:pyrimidine-nucleoside phosphorylase [uncultured Clostridium sp.]
MRMYDIIMKKRNNEVLTKEEIDFFIEGYTKENIPDYQVSALLMAIYFNGLNREETANLTMAMVNSGDVVDLKDIEGLKLDKHSTGGVGDKTSLILVPMVCAAGGKVAKLSGRGLGHTGGTLDKLEAIPGFNIEVSEERFKELVKTSGLVIAGQTQNLVPADKKIYALRDVTATVDSIPLIAASIMSKKIASGSDCILLDVKYGEGAFMKTKEDAELLARAMVDIGESLGKKTSAAITLMGEPLGYCIGNALEVKEVVEILKGKGPEDLRELCLQLGSKMLVMGELAENIDEARSLLIENLENGKALEKLKELVRNQGGDDSVIEDTEKLVISPLSHEVRAVEDGYIFDLDAEKVGIASLMTGAGRETKQDNLDYGAGIILKAKIGDKVKKGDIIGILYASDEEKFKKAEEKLLEAYNIKLEKGEKASLIYKII